jgi:hypothetical protein
MLIGELECLIVSSVDYRLDFFNQKVFLTPVLIRIGDKGLLKKMIVGPELDNENLLGVSFFHSQGRAILNEHHYLHVYRQSL